jgi:hypothetical protein
MEIRLSSNLNIAIIMDYLKEYQLFVINFIFYKGSIIEDVMILEDSRDLEGLSSSLKVILIILTIPHHS